MCATRNPKMTGSRLEMLKILKFWHIGTHMLVQAYQSQIKVSRKELVFGKRVSKTTKKLEKFLQWDSYATFGVSVFFQFFNNLKFIFVLRSLSFQTDFQIQICKNTYKTKYRLDLLMRVFPRSNPQFGNQTLIEKMKVEIKCEHRPQP